jgi:Domain of unknown function (DUF4249)
MVLKRRFDGRAGAAAAVVIALFALACSTHRSSDEFFAPGGTGTPVVDAVLTVGRPFPNIFLTRTLSPDEPFSLEKAGIRGAQVRIEGGADVNYVGVSNLPGAYYPSSGTSNRVQPATTYRLVVDLPDGATLKAATTTPDPIQVGSWVLLDDTGTRVLQQLSTFADFPQNPDTLYQLPQNRLAYAQGLIEIRLESAPAPAYQVGLLSLDLDSPLLIDTDFLDPSAIENFTRANHSPPLEVKTSTSIRLPWFAVYYEGRYKMRVFAMDRNWFDLARTDPVLGSGGFGFGGEAGDAVTRPIFHVEGGIGLFGSMSADSVAFYVTPPPAP